MRLRARRVHADVGVGGKCGPSATGEAVRRDRTRQWVRKPRESVRGRGRVMRPASLTYAFVRQSWVVHLAIELEPRVPPIDDHRALCARLCERPQFRCVFCLFAMFPSKD